MVQAASSSALPSQAWAAASNPRHWSPPPSQPPKPRLTSSDPSQRHQHDLLASAPSGGARAVTVESQGSDARGGTQKNASQHRSQQNTSQHSGVAVSQAPTAATTQQPRNTRAEAAAGRDGTKHKPDAISDCAGGSVVEQHAASPAFGSPTHVPELNREVAEAVDVMPEYGTLFFGAALQAEAPKAAGERWQHAQDLPQDAAVDASPASTVVLQSALTLNLVAVVCATCCTRPLATFTCRS